MRLVVIDIIGALLSGLGMWGLIEPTAAQAVPPLGISGAPLAALILGVGMMGYAIVGILKIARGSVRRAARPKS